jgi:hypothetical protein
MPPTTVYKPVSRTTATDPSQKLFNVRPPSCRLSSGINVPKTTPPAKMPTAIFVRM